MYTSKYLVTEIGTMDPQFIQTPEKLESELRETICVIFYFSTNKSFETAVQY
jgi:hypothetical protein